MKPKTELCSFWMMESELELEKNLPASLPWLLVCDSIYGNLDRIFRWKSLKLLNFNISKTHLLHIFLLKCSWFRQINYHISLISHWLLRKFQELVMCSVCENSFFPHLNFNWIWNGFIYPYMELLFTNMGEIQFHTSFRLSLKAEILTKKNLLSNSLCHWRCHITTTRTRAN